MLTLLWIGTVTELSVMSMLSRTCINFTSPGFAMWLSSACDVTELFVTLCLVANQHALSLNTVSYWHQACLDLQCVEFSI